ncbi:ATP synthase subunit b, mitochondrial [Nymphon striatum]|nr:ATP synthase subunit b, mitochondrial [Nymphon striatum]
MLSRLAVRGALLPRCLLTSYQSRPCATTVTGLTNKPPGKLVSSEEGPERDYVNYPPLVQNEFGGKVRLFCLPDEWFNAFYSKTGVTGPYMLCLGAATYFCSKEIYVLSPHTVDGIGLALTIYILYTKIGPYLTTMLDKESESYMQSLNDTKNAVVQNYEEAIKNEETLIDQSKASITLLEAKRENVKLQLEAEYRRRAMDAYTRVKNRLDYQLQVQDAKIRVEKEHMSDWITNNVVKSITPQLVSLFRIMIPIFLILNVLTIVLVIHGITKYNPKK